MTQTKVHNNIYAILEKRVILQLSGDNWRDQSKSNACEEFTFCSGKFAFGFGSKTQDNRKL